MINPKLKSFVRQRGKLFLNTYKNLLKENYKVLDVGCGSGQLAKFIENNSNWDIIGTDIIDVSDDCIPFVLMEQKDKLNFKDNSFDMVMFNGVLHHMKTEDRNNLFKEALRISKIILIFDEYPTLLNKFLCFMMCKIRFPFTKVYHNYTTPNELRLFFSKLNVKINDLRVESNWYYPLKQYGIEIIEN